MPFDKKWMGIVLFVPNYSDGGAVGFTAGAIEARVRAGHNGERWVDRAVPSRMTVQ